MAELTSNDVGFQEVYGICDEELMHQEDGLDRLTGAVYGHPMHKDGVRLSIVSDKITRLVGPTGEYFYETDDGVTYKTFHLTNVADAIITEGEK